MSTVAEIKEAITQLSLAERAELMTQLSAFEDEDWDRRMKADAKNGKFNVMDRAARVFKKTVVDPVSFKI